MKELLKYDNQELRDYWEQTHKTNWHFRLREPTISDIHYRYLVQRFFKKWAPAKPGLRVLKLDMYNEATNTNYANYYLQEQDDVVFAEISNNTIKHAMQKMQENYKFAHPIQCDFRKLPFKDESFDVSCSFGSIEHTPDWFKTLQEQVRVVKSGGRVIVGVPNLYNIGMRAQLCGILHRMKILDDFTNYEYHYTPKQLKAACENAGMDEIKISGYHSFPKLLRWFDLLTKYHTPNVNHVYQKLIEPILYIFTKVECKETHLNLLAEMLVASGIKK